MIKPQARDVSARIQRAHSAYRFVRNLAVLLAMLGATACEHGREVLSLATGPDCFSKALSREYLQISYVLDTHWHFFRAVTYRDLAARAGAGEHLSPAVAGWGQEAALPREIQEALDQYRALGTSAMSFEPFELAHAQGRLDCWAEFSIRENAPRQAAQCQTDFFLSQCYLMYREQQKLLQNSTCARIYGVMGAPSVPVNRYPWEC